MHHHEHDNDDRDEYLLPHGILQRAEGLVDEAGSIIKRNHLDLADCAVFKRLFRHARRNFTDFCFHPLDHFERVFSITRDDNTTDCFSSRLVQCATPQRGAVFDRGDLIERHRHIVALGNDCLTKVIQTIDKPQPPNHVFNRIDFNRARSDIEIAPLNRGKHFM